MSPLLQHLNKKQPFFFALISIGPLLLLSSRLVYALSISFVLLIHISVMLLLRFLIEKFLDRRLWFSVELFMAAVSIAIVDMLMGAYLPLLRADMGILLPCVLFQGQVFLLSIYQSSTNAHSDRTKTSVDDLRDIFRGLFGYIAMIIVLSLLRETLSYGTISMNIRPWEATKTAGTIFIIFTSTAGLLFLFAAVYMAKEEN